LQLKANELAALQGGQVARLDGTTRKPKLVARVTSSREAVQLEKR